MDYLLLGGIFAVCALSGFIGSLMGGGGFISVPLMILMGLSPHVALAANRAGSMGMEFSAMIRYLRTAYIYWPWVGIMACMACLGGLFGAGLAVYSQPALLEKAIAILILLLVPVFWTYKSLGVEDRMHHKTTAAKITALAGFFAVLVYGGFLGAGAAPLFIFCLSGVGVWP